MVVSIGLDDFHTIAIHSVDSGHLICVGKIGRDIDVYGLAVSSFQNLQGSQGSSGNAKVTGGSSGQGFGLIHNF